MFNFLEMAGTYDSRKVARFEDGEITVSTASVTDGSSPFETAISHPEYNDNNWVIVDKYNTVEEARQGHDKWVTVITTKPLPEKLVDCANANISQLADTVGCDMEFPRQ